MKTCLIIDDVLVSRYASKVHLEELGLQTLEAEDVESALSVLDKGNVDVLLLDWHLRKESGLELLETIRRSPQYKEVPVIVFSGVEDNNKAQQALNAGANSFLAKPTTKEKIEEKLKSVGIL